MVAVIVALLGFLAYRQIDRSRGKSLTVWVATSDLEPGTRIGAQHLTPLRTREAAVPAGVITDRRQIEGWDLVRAKPAAAPFVAGDLARPAPPLDDGLAGIVPEGRILMTFDPPAGLPVAQLTAVWRQGDRFDIFAVGGRDGPLHMARNVIYMGWIEPPAEAAGGGGGGDESRGGLYSSFRGAMESAAGGGGGSTSSNPLLLAVNPEDVRRLVWAQGAGIPLSIVLHGHTEVEAGALLELPGPPPGVPPTEVEVIIGANRQRVRFQGPP